MGHEAERLPHRVEGRRVGQVRDEDQPHHLVGHVVATHQPVEEQGRPGQLGVRERGFCETANEAREHPHAAGHDGVHPGEQPPLHRGSAPPGPGPHGAADEPHGPEVLEEVPRPLEDELLLAHRVAEHRTFERRRVWRRGRLRGWPGRG